MTVNNELYQLAQTAGALLKQHNTMLAVAESCTGGWLAEAITAVPGSSSWFDRGFITYSNAAKQDMLSVSWSMLKQFGAVSQQIALAMAEGALTHSQAHYAIAITGIAGPEGGTIDKPCGTVWIAWASLGAVAYASGYQFDGDRETIRKLSVQHALEECIHHFQRLEQ